MTEEVKKALHLPEKISVRSLASELGVEPIEVISKLMAGGVMAHINQDIDYDTAAIVSEEFGFQAEMESAPTLAIKKTTASSSSVTRPPIVTIMGHVDHGKTSLLDYIRQSNVVKGESGGITQHIRAYQINFPMPSGQSRKITFIDTPGHEAFSALRAHGASLTDLVILVVAADDGVKPQTVEALNHARQAGVPIIVAINKVDLPSANIDRVKQQLTEIELTPEDWGGKTTVMPISAKTGQGVDDLLELVVLTTDLIELKAEVAGQPEGIIIEANLDKQVGPVATILVYNGTIHPGQVVVAGKTYGRIKAMTNEAGEKLVSAPPATPAVITGLRDVPTFGDRVEVVPNEKVARTMTMTANSQVSRKAGETENRLPVILKADVGGSLAALQDSITKLKYRDASVEILSSGIGGLNENDINLAKTAKAVIISFRSTPSKRLLDLAQKEEAEVKEYWVIYEAIDFLSDKLRQIASPEYETVELGRLKILEVFSFKSGQAIVGGDVTEGSLSAPSDVKIFRDKEEVGTAKAESLRVGKLEAKEVSAGEQCGVSLNSVESVEKGDVLAFSLTREVK